MKGIERIGHLFETQKQFAFDRDFFSGWELYDTWDMVEIGRAYNAPNDYVVKEEDLLYYNSALGETDPLLIDPQYAAQHSPTGHVVAHPCFLVSVVFYCLGSKGDGTWLRTPAARNPFQEFELYEPIFVGERIRLTFTPVDRFVRRGKHYITNLNEFRGSAGTLKAKWWATLILPPTREEVRRYVAA